MTNRLKPAETYTHTHTHTHTHTSNSLLRIKQIGTICFAIFSFVFSAPTFADPDIPSSASTANCKNNPLQTYSGTSNLQANWSANTIQLHWYNGDDEIQNVPVASQSCVYDGTLTPPATIPTKTGYTFKGWRVRQVAQCSLSGLDTYISGTWRANKTSTGYCYYKNIDTGDEASNCSDSHFAGLDLDNGEWQVNFTYGTDGTVKGTSYCSGKSGSNHSGQWGGTSSDWSATESELTSASGEKRYCWCAATAYTPNNGNQCNIASPSWVFLDDSVLASYCAGECAYECARLVMGREVFRRAIWGISQ